jgi:hypothetical protein
MSSSTEREVSHDPREIEPRQIRSSRLNRKHPDSHSRKSSTSTEAKCLRYSSYLHLQKIQSWKHSTVLTKAALRSLKVMNILRTVTINVNHHPKCPFEVNQNHPQELKYYLIQ